MPVGRVFARDIGDRLGAELEMLVLDDARIRHFALGVVDDRDTLMVLLLEALRLEMQAAVLELAEPVAEILVNRARVDDLLRKALVRLALLQIVDARTDLDAIEQGIDQLVITANRDALIAVVEIVVVERIAYRQPPDDERWELRTSAAPLLLRVTLDQLRVDIRADERNRLLLEVPRLARDGPPLLHDDGPRLRRRYDVPELTERIHIERQVVEMPLIVRHRRIHEIVELDEPVDVLPDIPVARMEDMCPILMDMDAIPFLTVHIAARMRAPLHDQHRLSRRPRLMREHSPEKPAANDQILVHNSNFAHGKQPMCLVKSTCVGL